MRRRPANVYGQRVYPVAPVPIRGGYRPEPGLRNQTPNEQGDKVQPFYVSGGACEFTFAGTASDFDTVPFKGIQLVANVYVPTGQTGFIKAIRVAPFKPSFLGLSQGEFVELVLPDASFSPTKIGPDSNFGVWTTPFGWECYKTQFGEGEATPVRWHWHLRFLNGRIENVRQSLNIPPFSFFDPLSWFLIPDLPVPAGAASAGTAYPFGIPGYAPGSPWGRQRLQRLGEFAQGPLQVIVPGDTTIMLFAEWRQDLYFNKVGVPPDLAPVVVGAGFFPLLPSFGNLVGYTSPSNRAAAKQNARTWFA